MEPQLLKVVLFDVYGFFFPLPLLLLLDVEGGLLAVADGLGFEFHVIEGLNIHLRSHRALGVLLGYLVEPEDGKSGLAHERLALGLGNALLSEPEEGRDGLVGPVLGGDVDAEVLLEAVDVGGDGPELVLVDEVAAHGAAVDGLGLGVVEGLVDEEAARRVLVVGHALDLPKLLHGQLQAAFLEIAASLDLDAGPYGRQVSQLVPHLAGLDVLRSVSFAQDQA